MPKGVPGRAICKVENCGKYVKGRGYCNTHLAQLKRTGDPLGTSLPSAETRFWAKVDKSAGPDGCWLWTGNRDPRSGYGYFYVKSKHTRTHRFAYALAHGGAIPPGFYICHRCDNPPCCNPKHLFAGTQLANMADMYAKGRRVIVPAEKCRKGHPFTAENTARTSKGHRMCRTCNREWQREYRKTHPRKSRAKAA